MSSKTKGFASHPENINRKGRPPMGQSMTELMREYLEEENPLTKVTRKEEFIKMVAHLAYINKDWNAIKLIWNYLDGMPKQTIEAKIDNGLKDIPLEELEKMAEEDFIELLDNEETIQE